MIYNLIYPFEIIENEYATVIRENIQMNQQMLEIRKNNHAERKQMIIIIIIINNYNR